MLHPWTSVLYKLHELQAVWLRSASLSLSHGAKTTKDTSDSRQKSISHLVLLFHPHKQREEVPVYRSKPQRLAFNKLLCISFFLSPENSSQIQMCDFSQCKLKGMAWNFSRSIFWYNQAVVSVALPVKEFECCPTWSQACWFLIVMVMRDPGAALGLQRSFRLKELCGIRRCVSLRALTPFTDRHPSLFYSADWFIGAHRGPKTSVSLLALWSTTQTRVSHSAEHLQATTQL